MTSFFPKSAQGSSRRSPGAAQANARRQRAEKAAWRRGSPSARPARTRDEDDTAAPAIGRPAADAFLSGTGKGMQEDPEPRFGESAHRRDRNQEAPVLPGIKPVRELLQSAPERVDAVFLRKGRRGKEMERIVDLCRAAGVRFSLLEPASFARVYAGHSQGVVARLFEAGFADLNSLLGIAGDSPLPLVLALDHVQDPGNAGTLARTLYSLGGAGLIVPRHNGVYLGAAAAKAAAGALEKLPVARTPNLGKAIDSAKKQGFTIYGAVSGYEAGEADARGEDRRGDLQPGRLRYGENVPKGHAPGKKIPARQAGMTNKAVTDLFAVAPTLPAVLILGGEEDGMRSSMEKRCDYLIRIPLLRDFDSLNVAQAGAIIIGWFSRWASRQHGGAGRGIPARGVMPVPNTAT